MNLVGVSDCFGMVLCRMMALLNRVQVHSGVDVEGEDAGSGGGDMAIHGRTEELTLAHQVLDLQ